MLTLLIALIALIVSASALDYNKWNGNVICEDDQPSLKEIQERYTYQSLELTKPLYTGVISEVTPGSYPVVIASGILNISEVFSNGHFWTNSSINFEGEIFTTNLEIILGPNCDCGYGRFCEVESTDKTSPSPPPIRHGFSFPNIEFVYTTVNDQVTTIGLNIITNDGLTTNGWEIFLDSNSNITTYFVYQIG